jgi:hypothetical protein
MLLERVEYWQPWLMWLAGGLMSNIFYISQNMPEQWIWA